MLKNIVIIGSSGAIGNSFVEHYLKEETVEKVFTFSRSAADHISDKVFSFEIDVGSQDSIKKAAEQIKDHILFYVFYLSSPVLLFFSHTFLIESFAFLLAVSVLASFVLFAEKQSLKSAFLFICIATLCGLQKITGLMAALIGCGVYSLFILSNTNKSHFVRKISTLSIVFIISIILFN